MVEKKNVISIFIYCFIYGSCYGNDDASRLKVASGDEYIRIKQERFQDQEENFDLGKPERIEWRYDKLLKTIHFSNWSRTLFPNN